MHYSVLDLRLEAHRELGNGSERLVIAAWVGGELLITPETVAFDVDALRASVEGDGEFWLITCWCGIPECAGVDGPVEVVHEDGAVRWLHPYDWLPTGLVFEAEAYAATVRSASEAFAQAVEAWNEHRPAAIKPVPEVAGMRA
jgi:hypothetical protein